MRRKHIGTGRCAWLSGLLASIVTAGLSLAAHAQTGAAAPASQKQEIVRPANAKTAVYSSGSGPYYIEFRSRFAWDYGHTYIVHGRVGETPTRASVAGLSPVGDDATAWVVGHYVPVPAETGWTDGDLEDKYVTARYRVLVSKEQYDRIMAHVRELQSRSKMWSAELYNCNAFVADIATFMGLKVPSSTLIYPKIFVNNLRKINTGHPEAADQLISDNVKEMSSSTRDGRAMIVSGVHTVRPDGTPATEPAAPTSTPSVTIGAVRISNRAANPAATSDHSP